jgi:GT2 family glycosyltransferase
VTQTSLSPHDSQEAAVRPRIRNTGGAVTWPLVAVLTLNWNGRQWLGECVRSILALDYPNLMAVVIDNGSTDGSQEYVGSEFPTVHLIENGANLGYARGFNAGLEYGYAQGAEFFLIMNNDAVIDRSAAKELVQTALSEPAAGFVSGKVYWHERPDVLQTVGKRGDGVHWNGTHIGAGEVDHGQFDQVAERAFMDDIFTLVSRRLYEQVGGYDPQFFLQGEEFDWQVRAKRHGWRLYFTPHARLWHHGSLSMGGRGSPTSEYFFVRNSVLVMARHAGLRRFIRFYLTIARAHLVGLLKVIIRRDAPNFRSRLAAVCGLFDGTLWLVHRKPATGVPDYIRRLH